MRRLLALAFLFVAMAWPTAQVNPTAGAIDGTVTDSTKAVLPGVTVTASGPTLMVPLTTVTDANGSFRLPTVPVGDYKMTFELSGFSTVTREGIHISLGFTATLNIEMNPAGVAENVTVSGGAPVVDVQSTRISTSYDSEKLAAIPAGSRDYWAIAALTAGVQMSRPTWAAAAR